MKKYIKVVLLVLWLGVIFFFSSQSGDDSSNTSSTLLLNIVTFLRFKNPVEFAIKYSGPFRKLAHFTEFFILGVLMSLNTKAYIDKKRLILTIVLCSLYATSDELHQLVVPGRYFSVNDILIDSAGATVATFLSTLVFKCYQEKKH